MRAASENGGLFTAPWNQTSDLWALNAIHTICQT